MIKTGVIPTSEKGNFTGLPSVWQESDWKTVFRDNIEYKKITSFNKYWTQDIINQFPLVFETEEEYQTWFNSTDIVPTLRIGQDISDFNSMQRKAVCLRLAIDFNKNQLAIKLGVCHYQAGVEQKQHYKEIEFTASNSKQIEGVGDYDYFVGHNKTIPEIAISAILMRDLDGTINKKCNYGNN